MLVRSFQCTISIANMKLMGPMAEYKTLWIQREGNKTNWRWFTRNSLFTDEFSYTKIELQNDYPSRQWIFTALVYVRCAFALLFLNPQWKCRNITAIKTMENHGNSSIIWEMADKNPKLSRSVLLLHAKFSIYLGSWELKSYIEYEEMFSKAM